jgi:hypothetical protein
VELELAPLDGWFGLVALELDEPAPAEPLGLLLELEGAVLDEDEDEPPLA